MSRVRRPPPAAKPNVLLSLFSTPHQPLLQPLLAYPPTRARCLLLSFPCSIFNLRVPLFGRCIDLFSFVRSHLSLSLSFSLSTHVENGRCIRWTFAHSNWSCLFSLPSGPLPPEGNRRRKKKKKRKRKRRKKRETSHAGGVDLCQIKLKPGPSPSVACWTFGIWFAAFKVSIVGD